MIIRHLTVVVALVAMTGSTLTAEQAAQNDAEDMRDRLRRLVEEADPEVDHSLNTARANMIGQRLKESQGSAQERIALFVEYANEILLAGRTEMAIDRFNQVRELAEKQGAPPTKGILLLARERLALAHFRLGEQQNCIEHHGPESCIVPIEGAGVHQLDRGARGAIEAYTSLLGDFPSDAGYRWLLNLAYMAVGEYPDGVPEQWRIAPSIFESEAELARFVNIAGPAGVDMNALSGGVVIEDFDGDGRLDVMASSWGLKDQLRLFRNTGDGTFTDVTEEAGLEGQWGGLNLVHADYDNDGDADVLVLRGAWRFESGKHPNSLLMNRGDGTFEDVTEAAGLLSFRPTQAAAWADIDRDGDLDLFIGNESTVRDKHPSELYRNHGDGTFGEVAEDLGVADAGFVKAAVWGDYDNDGDPDLFVSCLLQPNRLFRNDEFRFTEVTREAGVVGPGRSVPAWFFDYDNDGHLDLLVAPFAGFLASTLDAVVEDMTGEASDGARLHLYHNEGDGTFNEVAHATGIGEVMLAMGANFGDLDNDGFLDCYFGTGEPDLATVVPNRMFLNQGGERFADVTTTGGFGHIQKGHGIAFGDLDNDGDQDIYAVMGGAYEGDVYPNALFENPGSENRWVTLILDGNGKTAQGARVRVVVREGGEERSIHRVVGTGGSFGSSSLQLEVGLGKAEAIVRVEVAWPGVKPSDAQVFEGVEMGAFVKLSKDGGVKVVERERFELARDGGGHTHEHE